MSRYRHVMIVLCLLSLAADDSTVSGLIARGQALAEDGNHSAAIDKYVRLGCDHIVLNQIGPDQDFFFEFFSKKLAPALRRKGTRRRKTRR